MSSTIIKLLENFNKVGPSSGEDFWKHQTDKWLKEKEDLTLRLLAHQKTDTHYLKSAEIVLELANKAYDLFIKQDAEEKRKLANILFYNSTFDGKTLDLSLRTPFNTIILLALYVLTAMCKIYFIIFHLFHFC